MPQIECILPKRGNLANIYTSLPTIYGQSKQWQNDVFQKGLWSIFHPLTCNLYLIWPFPFVLGRSWRKRSIPVAIQKLDKNNSDLIVGDGVPQANLSKQTEITHIIERLGSFPKPCPTPNEIIGIHGPCTYSISHVFRIWHH